MKTTPSRLTAGLFAGLLTILPVTPALAHADEPAAVAPASVAQLTPEQLAQQAALAEGVLADDSAYEFLGHLCDDHGGRLTGAAANHSAMLDTLHQLQAMGIDARLQTFRMPGWVRQDDEAVMVAPLERKLRATSLSYTQPHAPFEADVVDLGDGSEEALKGLDLKGKIGLLGPNAPTRRGGFNMYADELGLVGVLTTCRVTGGQLLCRTGSFQGEPIKIPVMCITMEEGKWMSRSLARGLPVRVRLHTRSYCKEIETANIVATFPGRTADTVILGGHFDSWDLGQGAIDNGLGVAQIFAVAKHLQEKSPQNLRTVELVWYNGEEQGLWGSRIHAPTLKGRPIVAMVNLDMVGFPESVNALGHADMIPVLEQFNASLGERKLSKGVDNKNWMGSDHVPYLLEGYRAITFGGPIPPEVVRYYHDFGDTFDKIDPKMLAEASATISALIYWLANNDDLASHRYSEEEVIANFTANNLVPRLQSSGMWPFKTEIPESSEP